MARLRALAIVAFLVAAIAPSGSRADGVASVVEIKVLSNRADLISGGDALLEVVVPDGVDASTVRVDIGGLDVTRSFSTRGDERIVGLVRGLALGPNRLTARLPHGSGARISITNHPIGGPVFAGRQVQPWICRTVLFGLGPSTDDQCNAPTRYTYKFLDGVTGQFQEFIPALPPPLSEIATTVTDDGVVLPVVVRIERGTMDRGIYEIVVLWDPTGSEIVWNRKLRIPFGGGCHPDHQQSGPEGGPLNQLGIDPPGALLRGFMLASTGLNGFDQNCNDVVAAEALMMLKERIIESYGEIRYTISTGTSGGGLQQQSIAANYPGLLDGIEPTLSFPDLWTTFKEAEDCHLLNHAFALSPDLWTDAGQKTAVTGYETADVCNAWETLARDVADPDNGPACLGTTGAGRNPSWVYNRESNPHGVRCTVSDYAAGIWGARESDGFANRPYDNVGVEYGLTALQSGTISAEQFVDLNEKVGGIDIDWDYQAGRSVADPVALDIAYRTGRVNDGRGMATVPILDQRGPASNSGLHSDYNSYEMRARLDGANGHHDNQVIWKNPTSGATDSFAVMDEWLANIEADDSSDPLDQKVARNKPAGLVDTCWIGNPPRAETDPAACFAAWPYHGDARIAAGASFSGEVLKCALKPLERADHATSFTGEQWARLEAAFPSGVCDWSAPGISAQPAVPWITFVGGPGGEPLGPPPASTPL